MVKRVTPSQLRSMLQQQENRRKQALRKVQQEIQRVQRKVNEAQHKFVRDVNREIDQHNRDVRQNNQKRKAAVQKYNTEARSHNARVERDRQRRLAALRGVTSPRFVEVRDSSVDLNASFDHLAVRGLTPESILSAAQREVNNSAALAYSLNAEPDDLEDADGDSGILDYLSDLSEDLCNRWRGAIYALNPANADAARHFCTSVREIFTEILDRWADNRLVLTSDPDCEKTQQGTPSRRAKIRYLLGLKGANSPEMLGFVEKDIDDILQLFPTFNKATHGPAGNISFASLTSLRVRVEGGIMFLATIAA